VCCYVSICHFNQSVIYSQGCELNPVRAARKYPCTMIQNQLLRWQWQHLLFYKPSHLNGQLFWGFSSVSVPWLVPSLLVVFVVDETASWWCDVFSLQIFIFINFRWKWFQFNLITDISLNRLLNCTYCLRCDGYFCYWPLPKYCPLKQEHLLTWFATLFTCLPALCALKPIFLCKLIRLEQSTPLSYPWAV